MKKRRFIIAALFMVMLITTIQPLWGQEVYQAARSYTNAKEFYESTAIDGEEYHAEMINGTIYYATSAKLASSSTNLRYHTVGFDITLFANGHSVSFTVQRTGGSMVEIDSRNDSRYEYILYAIKDKTLFELASKANSTEASYVLEASVIHVNMNAILTTKQGNQLKGDITENGSGGFTQWGTIYRLKNTSDLNALKQIFTGHEFKSYINIGEDLDNHQLQIRYQAQGLNSTSSTTATVGDGYSVTDGFLHKGGTTYIQKQRVLQQTTLLNPYTINLQKQGYHLTSGQEWITKDSRVFNPGNIYMPQTIEPLVGSQDKGITMYANWIANRYTVNYDANGGDGTILSLNMVYDTAASLANNTFTRRGYSLPAGKEWVDEDGHTYQNGQTVSNLTPEDGGTVILMANWHPDIYTITLDNQGAAVAGTGAYYVRYDNGNYSDSGCTAGISEIEVPKRSGYTFMGYYTGIGGTGNCYVDSSGKILSTGTTFDADRTLYAYWKVNTYTIMYHANGGTGTMEDTSAVYNESVSLRPNAFSRTGYTFKGWAVSSGGEAVYTDKQSVSNLSSANGATVDLYAVWEPLLVHVTLDRQGGSGGTDDFYEKYANGFYSDSGCAESISEIISPGRTGYTFLGYFENLGSGGEHLISPSGEFLVENTYFLWDTSIYADWEPNKYKVLFDKQGGELGDDYVVAVYDSVLPTADAPVKSGYSFKGYYTQKDGGGTMYYNENMASDVVYKLTDDSTVYAYWVDETPPAVTLRATSNTWMKSMITLTADASDLGTGLGSVVVYVLDADGNAAQVKSDTSLNGAKSAVLSYDNPTEGIVRYKAVATDKAGMTSESYCTVFYDKTPPKGRVKEFNLDINAVYFDIDVTDINVK